VSVIGRYHRGAKSTALTISTAAAMPTTPSAVRCSAPGRIPADGTHLAVRFRGSQYYLCAGLTCPVSGGRGG